LNALEYRLKFGLVLKKTLVRLFLEKKILKKVNLKKVSLFLRQTIIQTIYYFL